MPPWFAGVTAAALRGFPFAAAGTVRPGPPFRADRGRVNLAAVGILGRLHPLDRLAAGLFLAGLLCVAAGLLPAAAAEGAMARSAPLLAFLASVIVLAELTGRAQVFDTVATAMARAGRGSYPLLFGLCVVFASVTTVVLNLDTTAVLLTPVMLALATRLGISPLPLAMTTVWLANTASLLLPVSNLTNLLAADRVALAPAEMAAAMWAPQLAAVAVTAACLWGFYWRAGRRGSVRYAPPERRPAADPVRFRVCALACAGFLTASLTLDVPLWCASTPAALAAVAVFAVRDREALRLSLIPWRLLVLLPGLLLVVETVDVNGLHRLLTSAIGPDGGVAGLFRTAAVGAVMSNVLNNLPVYLAGESAVPVGRPDQLLALLVGTNAGPLVTPWASLASLLWFERCHRHGLRVRLGRFMGTGLVLAVTATAASSAALAVF